MPFFTRPNLDDIQFRQEPTSVLSLSGTTNFIGTLQSKGVEIDATTGGTYGTGNVALGLVNNKIQLMFVSGGTGSGSTIYTGRSPSTCKAGGLNVGTVIAGCEFNDLFQEILAPALNPALTNPFNSFGAQGSPREVGTVCNLAFNSAFNQGCINPQYTSTCDKRTGDVNQYNYTGTGLPPIALSTILTDSKNVNGYTILSGLNSWSSSVSYDIGVQPKDSEGNDFNSPFPAGTTGAITRSINGIYPVYYGKLTSGSRPPVTNGLVVGGTKSVVCSTSTVTINFNSSTSEYTWMAIPSTSASKTCWYVNALDNGLINSAPSDKYPDECLISITSAESCWTTINYKVYMSGTVGEITDPLQFRNS